MCIRDRPETAGLEPEDIVAGQFGEHIVSPSAQTKKGSWDFGPISPSLTFGRPYSGLLTLDPFGSMEPADREISLSAYYSAASWAGTTFTKARPSFVVNRTRPFAVAKRVWSLPMPTLAPACHLVRCV